MNKKYISLVLVSVLLTACGSSKSKEKIDISEYLPTEEITKSYLQVIRDKEGQESRSTYEELVSIDGASIKISVAGKQKRSYTIQKESIIKKEFDKNNIPKSTQMKRFLSVGDTFYTVENTIKNEPIKIDGVVVGTRSIESKKECKLNDKLEKFSLSAIPYQGDILEFECLKKESIDTKIKEEWEGHLTDYESGSIDLDYDLSYFYFKRGAGLIVDKDDNCYIIKNGIKQINDKAKEKECKSKTFIYKLFLS